MVILLKMEVHVFDDWFIIDINLNLAPCIVFLVILDTESP